MAKAKDDNVMISHEQPETPEVLEPTPAEDDAGLVEVKEPIETEPETESSPQATTTDPLMEKVETTKTEEPVDLEEERQITKVMQGDRARMAEVLAAQTKIELVIPLSPGEKKGLAKEYVNCNGYDMWIPKGVRVRVPAQIAEIILESQGINSDVHDQFNIANHSKGEAAKNALT